MGAWQISTNIEYNNVPGSRWATLEMSVGPMTVGIHLSLFRFLVGLEVNWIDTWYRDFTIGLGPITATMSWEVAPND